jgi:hypothetical protein
MSMLDSILGFIMDPAIREALSWVGGGVVVAATGIWAVVEFVAKKKKENGDSSRSQVMVENVAKVTISSGLDEEERARERHDQLLGAIASSPRQRADNGGVVISGDVIGSKIITRANNAETEKR